MIINNELKELLGSRRLETNSGKVCDSPLTILEPSIKIIENYVDESNYRIKSSIGSINRNDNLSANIAYNKVIIEFKLNTTLSSEDYGNVCIVYDLTGKVPIYKTATGRTLKTCLNMCIWADTDLYTTDNHSKIADRIQLYCDTIDKRNKEFEIFRDKLENESLSTNDIYKILGKIIYNSKSSVLRNAVVDASEELQNSKSPYYTIENENTTLWNVYNAITQQFSNKFNKSYLDVPSHTLELSKIVLN